MAKVGRVRWVVRSVWFAVEIGVVEVVTDDQDDSQDEREDDSEEDKVKAGVAKVFT